jgi:integrase
MAGKGKRRRPKGTGSIYERDGVVIGQYEDLGHTCATLLLTKGVHPKIVQEMLGHSSITITLDLYSHVLPDTQEKAVKAMDDILDG